MAKKESRLNLENEKGLNDILDRVQEDNAMVFMSIPGNNEVEEPQEEPKEELSEEPQEESKVEPEKESSEESANKEESSGEPVKKNQSDLNQMKFKKPKEELKDKRFSLLVKPSLYNRLKDLAAEQDTSVNNVINVILESVLEAQKGK